MKNLKQGKDSDRMIRLVTMISYYTLLAWDMNEKEELVEVIILLLLK